MKKAICAALITLFAATGSVANAEPQERTSTVDDRESVNVTVYNGSMSLIHDRRRVSLNEGVNRIAWRDVSAGMDATSALLEDLEPGAPARVLEQNLDYDLLDPAALLQKYVGRDVVVVHDPQFAGDKETRETARILSAANGSVILRYRDRIETEVRGHIVFPTGTGTFRDQPTLVLDLQSDRAGTQTIDLSYLTTGLSWRADYVGSLSPDERSMNITGLVTLSNTSGASYDNARLQLVAGNVNVVNPEMMKAAAAGTVQTEDAAVPPVQQENYFEYHLYTMARPTNIQNNQTKQVTLLVAHGVPVRKTLELRGSPSYYESSTGDLGDKLPIGVYVSFENRGGELGIPLPGGIVRLYKNDSRGLSQFLGSDQIQHTPKNETVRLHLGDSFDVTANKKQTDFKMEGSCSAISTYDVKLGNAKPVEQDVLVVEPIPAQWTILAENYPHAKSSSSTATWLVHVAPESHATLTYTSLVTWCP